MSLNHETPQLKCIRLFLRDKAAIQAAYMPFLKEGGIFVSTHYPFKMGDEVELLLKFLDEKQAFLISTFVVWITPMKAQGNRLTGIGLMFKNNEAKILRDKIESYLSEMSTNRPNHTV